MEKKIPYSADDILFGPNSDIFLGKIRLPGTHRLLSFYRASRLTKEICKRVACPDIVIVINYSFIYNFPYNIGVQRKLVEQYKERGANFARWGVILHVVLVTILFSARPDYFIGLVNLTKYDGVIYAIYTVSLVAILYLIGKNESNLISLLGPSKTVLKIGVILFFVTIATYLSVVIMPSIYGIYVQRILFYAVMSIVGIVVFHRNRINYYSNYYK